MKMTHIILTIVLLLVLLLLVRVWKTKSVPDNVNVQANMFDKPIPMVLGQEIYVEGLQITFSRSGVPVVDKAYNSDRTPGIELVFRYDGETVSSTFYGENGYSDFHNFHIQILGSTASLDKITIKVSKN